MTPPDPNSRFRMIPPRFEFSLLEESLPLSNSIFVFGGAKNDEMMLTARAPRRTPTSCHMWKMHKMFSVTTPRITGRKFFKDGELLTDQAI